MDVRPCVLVRTYEIRMLTSETVIAMSWQWNFLGQIAASRSGFPAVRELFPETSGKLHILTRLSAQESFVKFCCSESFQYWCHDSLIVSNKDKLAWFQASAAVKMSFAPFWGFTYPLTVFCSRRYRTTYRSHLQESSNPRRSSKGQAESSWTAWSLNVGPIGCPETTLAKYR
jgi:hypothetical protein